jgi:hypothetical protein
MKLLRSAVSVTTALAFFVQATGLAYAQDVQPVPYAPSQPVPLPSSPPSGAAPVPAQPPPPSIPPPAYTPAPGTAPGPVPAYAPAPRGGPGDTVYLKDGGMMRGTLVELLPNDHVTMQLPTGQIASIEWARIDHIERGTVQAAPMAPMPPMMGAPPPRGVDRRHRGGSGATAFLHIDADPGIVLESISPGSGRWAVVCAAPCDAQVPLEREYRIVGEGIRPSRAFAIEANPGQHVVMSVSAASRAGFSAGLALSSVGGAAVVVGLVVLFYGAFGACQTTDAFGDCLATQADPGVETVGAVISIAGVAILVTGIILMASNARTHAVQSVSVADLLPTPPARPETAWLRAPMWHDSTKESTGFARPMGFPIFSRSF